MNRSTNCETSKVNLYLGDHFLPVYAHVFHPNFTHCVQLNYNGGYTVMVKKDNINNNIKST